MKNKKGKPSKVIRKVVEIPRTPLPKNVPKTVNPKLENVKYQQPKKGKYRQPKEK